MSVIEMTANDVALASEVLRLRKRVEVLERALGEAIEHVHAIIAADHNERAANTAVSNWRSALETKP